MAEALAELAQGAWSSGIVRATSRDRIPKDGAFDIRDGLLDDDGNVYQRGALARLTSSAFGTALTNVWAGSFFQGERVLIANGSGFGALNAAGTAVTAFETFGATASSPLARIADLGLFLVQASGVNTVGVWAGSQKVRYSTGTVTVTNGSKTVTGSGTLWLANVDKGMILDANGYGVVESIDSNTQITLREPWAWPSGSGLSGALQPWVALSDPTVAVGDPDIHGTSVTTAANRVLVGQGHKVLISKTVDPDTGAARPFEFAANDYHEFPGDVVALATLRDVVFVFTKAGIYALSNVGLEIVDAFGNAQHRIEKVSGDVIARAPGGFAYWRDSVLFVALDGVYVLGASGSLDLISRNIGPLLRAHVDAGHTPGQMIAFRDHVFVPVGGDLFVGRLDRRVKTSAGESAPWTRLVGGDAGSVRTLAVQDPYGAPKLVAGQSTTGFLLDMSGIFASAVSGSAAGDPAGSYSMVVETREFLPGDGNVAMVRDVVLDYVLGNGSVSVAAAGDGGGYASLVTSPGVNSSDGKPRAVGVTKSCRRIALRLTFSGSAGSKLRTLRLRSRLRGRWS